MFFRPVLHRILALGGKRILRLEVKAHALKSLRRQRRAFL